MDVRLATERLPQNIKLLSEAVDALEQLIREAETLDEPTVRRALPFTKLFWLYASGMRDLLNSRRRDGRFLWNAPALAALCRPLQDSFLCFFYFGIEQVGHDEAAFRELLLRRHESFKRLDLLTRADQKVPAIAAELIRVHKEAASIQEQVLTHRFFSTLPSQTANEIKRKQDGYLFEPHQDTWQRAGLPPELYEVIFRYLSQWVHGTPYALTQMQYHRANHEDGAVNMNVPVGLALSCTCLVLDRTARLATSLEELLPKGFREFLGE